MYVEDFTLKLFMLTLEIKSIAGAITGQIMDIRFTKITMAE